MQSKRKRDPRDEGVQIRKKPHVELRRRYQNARNIADILVNGSDLRSGHITGVLKEIIPNGEEISLVIRDDSDKTICCIFSDSKSKLNCAGDLNARIGKRVQVALTSPERIPTAGLSSSKYPYSLRFHQYCFTIDGQMFEDTKNKENPSYISDSTEEEEKVLAKPPLVTKPAPERKASTSTSTIARGESRSSVLPNSLISIRAALGKPPGTMMSVAGVVHSVRDAVFIGNSGDWGSTVELKDQTCGPNEFLEVKLYAKKKEYLPNVTSRDTGGDIAILFSNIRVDVRSGKYKRGLGRAAEKWRYCCFSKASDGTFASSMDNQDFETYRNAPVHQCTDEEVRTLRRLVNGDTVETVDPRKDPRQVPEKRLEEIALNDIFTCTVELLDVFTGDDKADIRVTDYTRNPSFVDPKTNKYPFPKGSQVLHITLFDRPAEQARVMEVGRFYRIPRVRFSEKNGYKQGRCGKGPEGKTMPEVLKLKESDPLVKNLLARKRAYESGDRPPPTTAAPLGIRRSANTEQRQHQPDPVSECRTKKPVPTKPHARLLAEDPPSCTFSHSLALPKVYSAFPEYNGDIEVSDLVECAASDLHPLKTIKEIYDSPEVPCIFRFQGRIVDVVPSNLVDAIVSACLECNTVCNGEHSNKCSTCKRSGTIQSRVRLQMTFQDASGILLAKVEDKAADGFFRISKNALRVGNRDTLLTELEDRFRILLGPSSGLAKYEVGGLSEVMELVVKSWHVREGGAGVDAGYWVRYHKLSGCRVNWGTFE